MDSLHISCVIKNDKGVITHVGINGRRYLVENAVYWLQNKKYTLYTIKNDNRAEVYALQHYLTHKWFLTTIPDNTLENNLDFLPTCLSF